MLFDLKTSWGIDQAALSRHILKVLNDGLPVVRQAHNDWFHLDPGGKRAYTSSFNYQSQPSELPFGLDNATADRVIRNFAGEDALEQWNRDGTVIVEDLFSYLEGQALDWAHQEFDMYLFHHKVNPGSVRMGWNRVMYFSLIQDLVRTDPVYWALTAASGLITVSG